MKRRLRDIADVRSGYQFREKVEHDPQGKIPLIQIKDLSKDFRLSLNDLIHVSMSKIEPYRVMKDDVLFLARGQRLGAAAVTEEIRDMIATGYFFILTPSNRVRAKYLAWAINQRGFQDQMRPLIRGSHMPLVTKGDFEELSVDVPPLDVQRCIEEIDDLQHRENYLIDQIEEKRAKLIHAVCMQAATGRVKQERVIEDGQ